MKCGPEECPIVAFSDLTPTEQRTERKRIADKMYKQGFTEHQIATQLGVSQSTIRDDLDGLVPTTKPPRPKGGRPKGSSRVNPGRGRSSGQAQITPAAEAALARAVLDDGKSLEQAAKEVGLKSDMVARFAVAREQGRREAKPIVTRDMLSVSAQQKFDAAIRSHTARLNKQFEQRVNDEVRSRIAAADDAARAQNKELRKEVDFLRRIVHNRAVFTLEQFRQMQMLCHPDSSASEKTKAQLSQLLAENKIKLVKDMSHA